MLRRYTNNIDFDLYRNAADKLGISFVSVFGDKEPFGYFLLGDRRVYIQKNKLGINNSISSAIARNRYATYRILDRFHLPCPRAILLRSDGSTRRISGETRKLQKPFVVKPRTGFPGNGVSVRLESSRDIISAIRRARQVSDTVLIEEFVAGTNYRISVVDDDVIDVLERIPAHVVGDGTSTIRKLIAKKNEARAKVSLRKISIDSAVKRSLATQKLDPTSIPEDRQRVSLRLNCNLAAGGETKRLDMRRDVHPDNLKLFVDATREMGLRLAGIDFITPDISVSYKETKCVINEINRAPLLDVHYYADFAMNNLVGEKILAILQRERA
jgi:cyanophycin synthetase